MIEEDNDLIAAFMGLQTCVEKSTGLITYKVDEGYNDWECGDGYKYYYPYQLPYSTSWDWIMPVVDKIYKWGSVRPDYGGTIRPYKYLADLSIMADIKQTHLAVVEFIKWYNENSNDSKRVN